MAIESIHFVAGRVLEISRMEESYGSPVTVTIAGPEGELGSFPHLVQLFNSQRAAEFLRSDVKVSDTILAEVSHMRFVTRHGDGGGHHFLSHLALGGILEKAQGYPDSSRHFLRAVFKGSAHSPKGGLEVQLREKRDEPDVQNDFVFVIGGRAVRSFRKARLVRGEEILVRTSELRPKQLTPSGNWEFTGTGFGFFQLGFETMRRGDALRHRRRPAIGRSSLAEALPANGPAAAIPTDGYEVAMPTDGYEVAMPTDGYEVAMPTDGYEVAMPTDGYEVAMPTDGYEVAMPMNGYAAAVPANGYAVAVPADISAAAGPANGYAAASPANGFAAAVPTGNYTVAVPTDICTATVPANGYAAAPADGFAVAVRADACTAAGSANGSAATVPGDIRAAAGQRNVSFTAVPTDGCATVYRLNVRATETPMTGPAASAEAPEPVPAADFPAPDTPEPDGREKDDALPARPRPDWRFQPRFCG